MFEDEDILFTDNFDTTSQPRPQLDKEGRAISVSKQGCPRCGRKRWVAHYLCPNGELIPTTAYRTPTIDIVDLGQVPIYDECVRCHTVVC